MTRRSTDPDSLAEFAGFARSERGILRIDKSEATQPFAFSIKATTEAVDIDVMPKNGGGTQSYAGVQSARITGSAFDDEFTLVNIDASVGGRISIDGGAGIDRVTGSVGDRAAAAPTVVDVTNGVIRLNDAVVLKNIEEVDLTGSPDSLLRISGTIPDQLNYRFEARPGVSVDFDFSKG